MGGFAALIGGLGQGAQLYGNQVRGFLEQRRESMASQLLQEAGRTWDPEHRSNLLQGVTDLISGVPMNKALTPVLKSYQTHEQGTQWHAQLGQAVQQAMPQPGPSQPGPAAVGQQPGTTLPADITAALPPLSPVAPEAQGGGGPTPAPFTQGLAPNSPLAPPAQEAPPLAAAIGQPAQPAAAAPLGGPIPQAGPQAFEQPFDPLEYTQRAYEFLKGLPQGAREGLAPDVLQGAEATRQLGIAYVQMGWRRQQAEPAIAEMDQVLNNPDSSLLERMAARSAKMQAYEWIAGGGAAPSFPLTGSTMARMMTNDIETVDVSNWSPKAKADIGLDENASGPWRIAADHMTKRPVEAISEAPVGMQVTAALDQNTGQVVPVITAPQRPAQPPQRLEPAPGLTPFAPGWGSPLLQTDIQGRNFIAPKQPGYTGGVPQSVIPGWSTQWRTVKEMTPTGQVERLEAVPEYHGRGSFGAGAPGPVPTLTPPATLGAPQATPTATGAPQGGPSKAAAGAPASPLNLPGLGTRTFAQTLPNQLTQNGQNTLRVIDTVLGQIDKAQAQLKQYGLDQDHSFDYFPDYLKYKQTGESKYKGLYTNIQFERYRSGAAAMQGTGSRAHDIFLGALDHTPALEPRFNLPGLVHGEVPKFTPDTPAGMNNKLGEMKQMLQDAKQKVYEDEQKSGLVPTQGAGTPTPAGTAVHGGPLKIILPSKKTMTMDGNTITFQ